MFGIFLHIGNIFICEWVGERGSSKFSFVCHFLLVYLRFLGGYFVLFFGFVFSLLLSNHHRQTHHTSHHNKQRIILRFTLSKLHFLLRVMGLALEARGETRRDRRLGFFILERAKNSKYFWCHPGQKYTHPLHIHTQELGVERRAV